MKRDKIIFWIATIIIILFEGVMPLFFFNSDESKAGMAHLGYPHYFGPVLTVFKVLGSIALVVPAIPRRFKEAAYAGFTFDFLFASISHYFVDGVGVGVFFPLGLLVVLMVSYYYFNRLEGSRF